mmetsp:Transcript_25446/g.53208  ORF Transcript_25446/g.53208 Transcript_25446/m.53208 type:complete len:381 (-) Transcript_25446:36-1178(-)|eukprot:CAMPEP_0196136460 /NCGR_PEP_ID=MMETSP0910-20130528/4767_1 /TAXON_ID=49265 /ORGANISM="Thalassiosira rotula, Strain GSO102" /LENGTH=380 /DNA_ID=CAMNT_0041396759 /DNA_START=37 /DNA_END=1179 /DNA_ORIENTATION=-
MKGTDNLNMNCFYRRPPRPRSLFLPVALIALGYCLAFSAEKYYLQVEPAGGAQVGNNKHHWSCTWSPTAYEECSNLLRRRLPPPTRPPDLYSASGRQRWLFLGDSQMSRLFRVSNIEKLLVEGALRMSHVGCLGPFSCIEKRGYRCDLNKILDLAYAEKWVPPRPHMFAGPTNFGLNNPYCSDGSGSFPAFLQCTPQTNERDCVGGASRLKYRYGGFIPLEYATDVEIQTPEFRTTQENVAAFIDRDWNTPVMVQEWGKPICLLGTGNHDSRIKGITTGYFLRNVKFLLETFSHVCEHMIWIGNTANKKDDDKYPQTKELMKQWDTATKRMIEAEPTLRDMMTFIEVRRAALRWPHADHIHLDDAWYKKLGNELLIPLIR